MEIHNYYNNSGFISIAYTRKLTFMPSKYLPFPLNAALTDKKSDAWYNNINRFEEENCKVSLSEL